MEQQLAFTVDDTKEGDVLLILYKGFVSTLIALLDDCVYSHSAYYNGKDVLGVIRTGLAAQSLADTLADDDALIVDVFRFYGDNGNPAAEMGSPDWPVAPVTAVAEKYAKSGVSYAFNDLYYYWVLILLHNLPKSAEDRKKLWFVINAIAFTADQADPKLHTGMICSEFVSRLFLENDAFPRYALQFADCYQIPGPPDQEFAAAYKIASDALAVVNPGLLAKIEAARQGSVSAFTPELVTPNTLRQSPSLKFQGRLKGVGGP